VVRFKNIMDKNKYFELSQKNKRLLRFLNIFILFFALPLLIIFYFNYAINRPSQTFKDLNYNLKSGDSIEKIASDLKDLGVINSENLFILYSKIFRIYPKIQAGIYTFPAGSSLVQVINQLQSGSNGIAIIFWEGKRLEEYGLIAASKLPGFDYEKFIEKTKGKEGMLFPDTYFFYPSANEDDVIRVMTENFKNKMDKIKKTEEYQKTTLTDNQIFIIASLLEKEAPKGQQRRYVAGIIINRLSNNDRLGIDASNQYGVALRNVCPNNFTQRVCPDLETAKTVVWWKPDLTKSDLALEEPFNTRINRGLPPHPISSFSEDAIMSVLKYIPSNYYYYLHDSNGGIHYAETASQHSENVSRYIRY
jgi:UPF0755 protein